MSRVTREGRDDMTDLKVWGGRAWQGFVREAFEYISDLRGKRALEIGFRGGEISQHFAERGAEVVSVETDVDCVARARPPNGVSYRHYSGNLDEIEGSFDLVFTKSVLVLTDLDVILPAINRKLAPDGRVVFIENGLGSALFRLARYVAHPTRDYSRFSYFTRAHIDKIGSAFEVERLRYNALPPVYLVCAKKRG
jgi:2-polyprenyl-3-methyl-5-hydroxy-6-metoxy-1,4-benzoquinol methylase